MLAWHFLKTVGGKPVLRDGRPAPRVGRWLEESGDLAICARGLHASWRALDALDYRPAYENLVACLVEVDGVVAERDDKLVCRRRRIVRKVHCDDVLRRFACEAALSVAHLWSMPPVVREYLETRDESKRAAAYDAAYDAANAAAYAAANAAANAANAANAAANAANAAAANAAAANAANAAAANAAAANAAANAARHELNAMLEALLLGAMEQEGNGF
jgi:hypothetical protein